MIEDLPILKPDANRSIRTLERCHKQLKPRRTRQTLERAAFAGLCVVYLTAVALDVARVLIR